MTRYVLAKVVSWGGKPGEEGLQGRKRLQKILFFLQHAGVPVDGEYDLHHYGPYSRRVADACDMLVSSHYLAEKETEGQYSYCVTDTGVQAIARHEAMHPQEAATMKGFEKLGRDLLSRKVRPLELGSTILFFFEQERDWPSAVRNACNFKKVAADDRDLKEAEALAKAVSESVVVD